MAHPTFADRLRASRKKRGLTQADVAEALGISVQSVSLWETGQTGASHNRIVLLGELLGVDWDWLGYGAEMEDPTVPVTLNEDMPVDFQKAPLCTRGEVARWIQEFPELDVEIEDALELDHSDYDQDRHREYFEPRFPPSGILFSIFISTKSMNPDFSRGDIIVCDTGIVPSPGDHVVAFIAKNKTILFRRYRSRRDDANETVQELVPENSDFPTVRIKAGDGDKIVATMVELRRYRIRKGDELTAYWQAVRKGYSRDT